MTTITCCPKCGAATRVIETYDNEWFRRRRRVCIDCDHRFSTAEIAVTEYKALQAAVAGGWDGIRNAASKAMVAQAKLVSMIDDMNVIDKEAE